MKRRLFIRNVSLAAEGLFAAKLPVFADVDSGTLRVVHNISVDKNIDPAWLGLIYNKSGNTRYLKSRNELKFIGMPCGGLHAGTVYFGGDGRLWLWQIFNETWDNPANEGIEPKTVTWNDGSHERKIKSRDGANYIEPTIADNKRILDQGFAVKIIHHGKTTIRELNEHDWDEVIFEATYPIATVTYIAAACPVQITIECFSPFIPLDEKNSSFPATILNLKIKNTSSENIQVSVVGWMENGCNKIHADKVKSGYRKNEPLSGDSITGLSYSFEQNERITKSQGDDGSMCFGLMKDKNFKPDICSDFNPWPVLESSFANKNNKASSLPANEKLIGAIIFEQQLAQGVTISANYIISWHFPNPPEKLKKLCADINEGCYYASRFRDAADILKGVSDDFNYLNDNTKAWQTSWYSSSLPDWFLERSIIPINTLATANTYRFKSGRFWSWEGVGACSGTCTHVWQYAHAMSRIFPALERDTRERVDLRTGFVPATGAILFRGEDEKRPAIDGQAGTILRFYREHQMSADASFLNKNWEKIKQFIRFLLAQDRNGDGMTDTPMKNTLDAVWEGEISWIVGLSIAAAKAGELMALEANDIEFARLCRRYADMGSKNMKANLFNGEYFIHRPDPVLGRKKLGAYNTCHIDQVYEQSWAYQVGMRQIIDHDAVLSALRSIWKYNFSRDLGPYLKTHPGGRPYILPGEGGIIINTNAWNEEKPYGEQVTWQVQYFHECMSGFEHEVIAHFMSEGMTDEALIAYHTLGERYHAAKRNPYNEIECSDHYVRAMASYGSFLSACGFDYHGPKKYIAFDPKISPENFSAAFTATEGWGVYLQRLDVEQQQHELKLHFGKLPLKTIALQANESKKIGLVVASLEGSKLRTKFHVEHGRVVINFNEKVLIKNGESLILTLS